MTLNDWYSIVAKSETVRKVISFIVSSLITGALYTILLFLFDLVLKWPFVLSISLSYISAMAIYFITNKLLIFHTIKDKKVVNRELLQFVLLIIINYLLTLGIVTVVRIFTGEVYSGSLLAGVVTIALTYFVFDKFIFTTRPVHREGVNTKST